MYFKKGVNDLITFLICFFPSCSTPSILSITGINISFKAFPLYGFKNIPLPFIDSSTTLLCLLCSSNSKSLLALSLAALTAEAIPPAVPPAAAIPPKIKGNKAAKGSKPPSFVSNPFPPFMNDNTFPVKGNRNPPLFSFAEFICSSFICVDSP